MRGTRELVDAPQARYKNLRLGPGPDPSNLLATPESPEFVINMAKSKVHSSLKMRLHSHRSGPQHHSPARLTRADRVVLRRLRTVSEVNHVRLAFFGVESEEPTECKCGETNTARHRPWECSMDEDARISATPITGFSHRAPQLGKMFNSRLS